MEDWWQMRSWLVLKMSVAKDYCLVNQPLMMEIE
jgi:hypothetical protein